MSRVFVRGLGAICPAGWGVERLRAAWASGTALPLQELPRPGEDRFLRVRSVPPPPARPACCAHPRLRRSSPITQYAVTASLEALGCDLGPAGRVAGRLGIVMCVMSGCVNYSRRFYDEVLREPATASPLVFPETVFNAPSSHLASLLGSTAVNYTLVGDAGTFVLGLALAAQWLAEGLVDTCLVTGAEELDWLTADAFRLFTRSITACEGAGALYLGREPAWSGASGAGGAGAEAAVELTAVSDVHLFWDQVSRTEAARRMAAQFEPVNTTLLCDGLQGVRLFDQAEEEAWRSWPGPRVSPKKILGEGLMAGAAWQCVFGADAVRQRTATAALVSVVGCNEQAIGCRFAAAPD